MRILVPVDFTIMATEGLYYAAEIARSMGAELTALHVIDTHRLGELYDPFLSAQAGVPADILSDLGSEVSGRLQAAVDELDVQADARIIKGHPAESIASVATELHASLIVMATHARKGISKAVVGNVTDGVVRLAPCPVLAAPPRAFKHLSERGSAFPDRILVATDFSEGADAALGYARLLCDTFGATLCVMHAYEPPEIAYSGYPFAPPPSWSPDDQTALERKLEEKMERICADLRADGLPAEWKLEEGRPAEMIVSAANDVGADAIVVGTHGRSGLRRLLLGSVAEGVLHDAPCPVFTISTKAAAALRVAA